MTIGLTLDFMTFSGYGRNITLPHNRSKVQNKRVIQNKKKSKLNTDKKRINIKHDNAAEGKGME